MRFAALGQHPHGGHQCGGADRVAVAQRAAAKGRKSGAHDHGEINHLGVFGQTFFQAAGGLIDHQQHHALLQLRPGQPRHPHAAGKTVGAVVDFGPPAGAVQIKPLAGFFAEQAGFEHRCDGSRHGHALAEGRAQSDRHIFGHIQTHLVHQAQGAHWHAELQHGPVHILHLGALIEKAGGLQHVGHQNAVDHKARAVFDHHRQLAHFLHQQLRLCRHLGAGVPAHHHFHQLHLVDGVEKMDAHHPARIPGGLRQFGDGQGRGVGGQKGLRPDLAVQVVEDFFLEFHLLHRRLDHQVATLKRHRRRRGGDAVPRIAGLQRLEHAAVGQQFFNAAHARAHPCNVQIAQDDAHVFGCQPLGDARAHDPGADDRDRRVRGAIGGRSGLVFALFRPLGLKEQPHQIAAGRRLRQAQGGLQLAVERSLRMAVAGGANDLQGFQCGRIVAVGFFHDPSAHQGRQQRSQHGMRRQGHPLALGLAQDRRQRRRRQRRPGRDLVNHPQPLGRGCRRRLAAKNDVQRLGQADQPRQPGRAAPGRQDAKVDFGQADFGGLVGRGNAPVAGQRHFVAAAHAGAVDRRHRGHRQAAQAQKKFLPARDETAQAGGVERLELP